MAKKATKPKKTVSQMAEELGMVKPRPKTPKISKNAFKRTNKSGRIGKFIPGEQLPDALKPKKIINRQALYLPHSPGQQSFHDSTARYKIAVCGRQYGKTEMAGGEGCMMACHPDGFRWIYVIAPVYSLTEMIWDRILKILPPESIYKVSYDKKRIELHNGSRFDFKSADSQHGEKSMRGGTLDLVILEEAGEIPDKAWFALKPALSIHKGKVVAIGTPKGQGGFFWDMYQLAKKGEPDYECWEFESRDNPLFDESEWLDAQKNYPATWFDQEYRGIFLPGSAGVFRNVDAIIYPPLNGGVSPVKGERYYLGVDIAKSHDFTWIIVLDEKGHVVHSDRWNHVSYPDSALQIATVAQTYNDSYGLMDSTGVGEPVHDHMRRMESCPLIDASPMYTTDAKQELILNLQLAQEQELIHIPDEEILVNELKSYGYEILESGRVRYSAPEGKHDDGVIALALAWKCYRQFHEGMPSISRLDVIPKDELREMMAEEKEEALEKARANGDQQRYQQLNNAFTKTGVTEEQREQIMERESAWSTV